MTIGSGAEKCQATWFERPKTKRAQHHSKVSFALQNVQRDSYGLATLDRAENPVCCHRENNEITRGNSYSTLWHVSARADSNRGYDAPSQLISPSVVRTRVPFSRVEKGTIL